MRKYTVKDTHNSIEVFAKNVEDAITKVYASKGLMLSSIKHVPANQTHNIEVQLKRGKHKPKNCYVVKAKRNEHETENERYGRQKNRTIDHNYIASGKYANKFRGITKSSSLDQLLCKCAREILNHRSGTPYEDMYWISISKEKIVGKSITGNKPGEVTYPSHILSIIKKYENDLITLHNHPDSMPPSGDDFDKNFEYSYHTGLTLGHNGNIFIYYATQPLPDYRYASVLSKIERMHGIHDKRDEFEDRKNCINELCTKYCGYYCKEVK